jgi:hypothetical protein
MEWMINKIGFRALGPSTEKLQAAGGTCEFTECTAKTRGVWWSWKCDGQTGLSLGGKAAMPLLAKFQSRLTTNLDNKSPVTHCPSRIVRIVYH